MVVDELFTDGDLMEVDEIQVLNKFDELDELVAKYEHGEFEGTDAEVPDLPEIVQELRKIIFAIEDITDLQKQFMFSRYSKHACVFALDQAKCSMSNLTPIKVF